MKKKKNREESGLRVALELFLIIFLAIGLFSVFYVKPKVADATKRLSVSPPTAEERAQPE